MNDDEKRRRKLELARKEAEWRDAPAGAVPERLPHIASDVEALADRVARLERQASTSAVRITGLVVIALMSSLATAGLIFLFMALFNI